MIHAFKVVNDLGDFSMGVMLKYSPTMDVAKYKLLIGSYMGNSYLHVIRPLQNKFPGLEMPELEHGTMPQLPGVDPTKAITSRFITAARSTVNAHGKEIQALEGQGVFRTGALREIESSLEDIEAFISAQP